MRVVMLKDPITKSLGKLEETYRIYSLIRRTIFYEKRRLFDENLLKIRGASYNQVFSRNDCAIQTTRLC